MSILPRLIDDDIALCRALRRAAARYGMVIDWDSPRPRQPATLGHLLAQQHVMLDLPAHLMRTAADRATARRLVARLVPAPIVPQHAAPEQTPSATPEPLTIRLSPRTGGAA
ncbi:MAG: hypothetical protein K1X74_19845 [Pirellulales bacterium]|nr:hypothetical protein [Pirellulales bacterium]